MAAFCDVEQVVHYYTSGFCSTLQIEPVAAVHQCTSPPKNGLTLFEIADSEQDGQFDLRDLADFLNSYQFTPKLEQSPAIMVATECCVPDAFLSELADCLSGPQNQTMPSQCQLEPVCTLGFTGEVGPGDYLYTNCAQSPATHEKLSGMCSSWRDDSRSVEFECHAGHISGHSLFIVADLDGDADFDLADYAIIQRDVAVP